MTKPFNYRPNAFSPIALARQRRFDLLWTATRLKREIMTAVANAIAAEFVTHYRSL